MSDSPCSRRERVLDYLEGLLSPTEETAFRKHVAGCPECGRALRETEEILALARSEEVPSPPPGMETRIEAALAQALARRGGTLRGIGQTLWRTFIPAPGHSAWPRAALIGAGLLTLVLVWHFGIPGPRESTAPLGPSPEVAAILDLLRQEEAVAGTGTAVSPGDEEAAESGEEGREGAAGGDELADALLAWEESLIDEAGVEVLIDDLSPEEEEDLTRFLEEELDFSPEEDPGGRESSYRVPDPLPGLSTPDMEAA